MPYKSEHIKLSKEQDRRIKLTDAQRAEIIEIYSQGLIGMRPLAKKYNVSRSLIQTIVNPARAERVKARVKEHWRDYVNRKNLADATRKLRRYKQELYLKGELK